MRRIGVRHLDNRLALRPREYFENPWTFGTKGAVPVMPPGGDPVSQLVALHHHRLVIAIRARKASGSAVQQRFGFGRDVWAEVLSGQRWPGETVHVAMLESLQP